MAFSVERATCWYCRRSHWHDTGDECPRAALTGLVLAGQPIDALLVNFAGVSPWSAWLAALDQTHLANIRTAGGLPQTYYITVTPVGNEILLLGQTDAAEQERLRLEVLELNHTASNLSRELALKNAELAQLNVLKNQFLGMATHDLRKPAGLILNYTEFLIEEAGCGLSIEHQQYLQTIRTAAQRMCGVIEEFLDVSLIEAGRLSLDLQPTDLGALVQTPLTLVNAAAVQRKIRVVTELDPAEPSLLVDGPKIEQVLTNLISNAVEHSPAESCVTITSQRLTTEFQVRVADAGQGIPPEQRQRLFQAFAGSNIPKPSGERSIGLGLTIASKIVAAHGGRMLVESEPGRGSVFGFTLPASCLSGAPTADAPTHSENWKTSHSDKPATGDAL